MTKTVKWSRYLWLSLLCFSFFLLELVSIFGIEMLFLRVDVWAYTPDQRARHSLITAALWAAAMAALLLYARRRYGFPTRAGMRQKSAARDWAVALLCLAGCKVMTFIDWQTLKIIGDDIETLAAFVEKLSTMSTHTGTNVTLSVSLESDKLPESVKSIVKFA